MAKTRMISTDFWSDTRIDSLDPIEKLLYIHCFSNDKTSWCWATEIPVKKIAYETWIDRDMVIKILKRFEECWKVAYFEWYLISKNFIKHHFSWFSSPEKWSKNFQLTAIEEDIKKLPDNVFYKCLDFITGFETIISQEWKWLSRGYQGASEGIVPLSSPLSSPSPEKKKRPEPKKTPFVPPTLEEVVSYFKENWYKEEIAKKAFNIYNVADWHDTKWSKVKVRKQKMHSVRFKDENKAPKETPKDNSHIQNIYDLSHLQWQI